MTDETALNPVELATELTIAWLGNQNNRIAAEEVPAFLRTMHTTLTGLAGAADAGGESEDSAGSMEHKPAVSVRKSLASRDAIISMIDGKPYKTLRRHLSTHGLTPEEYRQRYNLRPDYPMVAESYSEQRRAMAKKIGLGSRGRRPKAAETDAPAAPTRRRATKQG
ncbi:MULTISPECIES: MucR family transcriptional regulator [unclassified Sphingomonas]|uniref:MucR family transcriptional regulator n=1 Tax=unclassified Sphingomonas TaxID=196159 RepID=UPI00082E8F5D|nr:MULTISPECIES: MucR family transcriptional regulator [unclassified Sphingomonas]MCH4892597.1 transcriptional regulator [Sphingomonas sp. SFZ2018-12]